MTRYNVAEMNVAAGRWQMNDARMAEFVAAIAGVNAAADLAPGFVWRMPQYLLEEDAIGVGGQGNLLVNMSLWQDVESLREFTYASALHLVALRRRREWFHRLGVPNYVMWWVPEGDLPTVDEGQRRLALLAQQGPTPEAFTFSSLHPASNGASPHY